MKILLIRHGQSETNDTRTFTGQLDAGLSDLGRRQAALMAEFVASEFHIDHIFSSDLIRTMDTAAPLSALSGIPVECDPCLREIRVPQWEGRPFSELQAEYGAVWDRFFLDPAAFEGAGEGSESVREMAARFENTLRRICLESKSAFGADCCIAVVTHGTPIRAMLTLWSTGSLDGMKDAPWAVNASVTVADFDGRDFTLLASGLSEHLKGLCTTIVI